MKVIPAHPIVIRRLGLSVDWSLLYTTIGDRARRVSQRAFLRNLARGEAYTLEAPTLWDVDFKTAVAQAELEDREPPTGHQDAMEFGARRRRVLHVADPERHCGRFHRLARDRQFHGITAHERDPADARTVFYLAQLHADSGDRERGLALYAERVGAMILIARDAAAATAAQSHVKSAILGPTSMMAHAQAGTIKMLATSAAKRGSPLSRM